jgi:broad specificity phosphatase PhoE
MKKNNFCTIYIVRHGQSEANLAELHGLDTKLTDKGKRQAKLLAKTFAKLHFDVMFSSPLVRAHETAKIIAEEHKLEVLTKEALRERHEGVIDGMHAKKVREAFGEIYALRESLPYKTWKTTSIANGYETDEVLMSRFITVLREIALLYPRKTVLVASHVGLMKTFLIHLGKGTHQELKGQSIDNTGYIKLKTDSVDFFVEDIVGLNRKK